jgi:hypothetical protein
MRSTIASGELALTQSEPLTMALTNAWIAGPRFWIDSAST